MNELNFFNLFGKVRFLAIIKKILFRNYLKLNQNSYIRCL